MKRSILVLLWVVFVAGSVTSKPVADTVALKNMTMRLRAINTCPSMVNVADSLINLARRYGNQRYVCIGLTEKANYYYLNGEVDSVWSIVKQIEPLSAHIKQPGYFFFVWSRAIDCYYYENQYINALRELEKFNKAVDKWKYPQAKATYYYLLGSLYNEQNQRNMVIECMLKADSLYRKYNNYERVVATNQMIATTYADNDDYKQAEKHIRRALKIVEEHPQDVRAESLTTQQICLAICAYKLNNMPLAKHYYQAINYPIASLSQPIQSGYYELKSYMDAVDGNYEGAIADADSIYITLRKTRVVAEVNQKFGYYDKAYEALTEFCEATKMANDRIGKIYNKQLDTLVGIERQASLAQMHLQRALLWVCLGFLAILIVVFFYYVRRRRADLRRVEAQRLIAENAKQEALAADRLKNEFIRSISGEVIAPLNAIVGFSQLLQSGESTEQEYAQYAHIIDDNSKRLQKLVTDILDLSNLSCGSYQVTNMQIQAGDLCNMAFNDVRPTLPPNVSLKLEVARGDFALSIYTDINRVKQVLETYLAMGATQLEKEGGSVTLSFAAMNSLMVRFAVTFAGNYALAVQSDMILSGQQTVGENNSSFGQFVGFNVCRVIASYLHARCRADLDYKTGVRLLFEIPINQHLEEE